VFLALLRNLSGPKAFNLQLPHRMLSDLRGMRPRASWQYVFFIFSLTPLASLLFLIIGTYWGRVCRVNGLLFLTRCAISSTLDSNQWTKVVCKFC
jgi:hypothetical protein